MSIRNWPISERPREKLLARGAAALSDAELIAVFLRTGSRGRSALDLARDLLGELGSLRRMVEADRGIFCALPGLGDAKYAQLQAVVEMARRRHDETIARGERLDSPAQARDCLQAKLGAYPCEVFACLWLDNRHRVLAFEEMFRGTVNGASVHPREVVRAAIRHNAAAVILAHNHPSGVAEPSRADREITERLHDALALVDVRILDHLVIGGVDTTSFAERGLL